MQQGDVLLRQTNDDGDIEAENGLITMTAGLDTMAYISLFGGQSQWWGDLAETDPDIVTPSETEQALENLPAVPASLRRVEQAARRDLAVFINKSVANRVDVVASIPTVDQIKLNITIEAQGAEMNFEFTENWKASI